MPVRSVPKPNVNWEKKESRAPRGSKVTPSVVQVLPSTESLEEQVKATKKVATQGPPDGSAGSVFAWLMTHLEKEGELQEIKEVEIVEKELNKESSELHQDDQAVQGLQDAPQPTPENALPLGSSTAEKKSSSSSQRDMRGREQMIERFSFIDPLPNMDTTLTPVERAEIEKERETKRLAQLARHLVQAGSDVDLLLTEALAHRVKKEDHLRKALALSCRRLRQLLDSQYLRSGVKLLADVWRQDPSACVSILMDFDQFLEEEKVLLTSLGASDSFVNTAIKDARTVLENLQEGKASRRNVFETIALVTGATCERSYYLNEQALRTIKRENLRKMGTGLLKGFAGGGLIAVNASIHAAGFESLRDLVVPVATALALVVGEQLIEAGIEGFESLRH